MVIAHWLYLILVLFFTVLHGMKAQLALFHVGRTVVDAGSVKPSRRVRRRVRGGSHLRRPRDCRQLGPSVLSFERSDDKIESIIVIT